MNEAMKRARINKVSVRLVTPMGGVAAKTVSMTCELLKAFSELLGGMAEDLAAAEDDGAIDVTVNDEWEANAIGELLEHWETWTVEFDKYSISGVTAEYNEYRHQARWNAEVTKYLFKEKDASVCAPHIVDLYHTLDKYDMQCAMKVIHKRIHATLSVTSLDLLECYRNHPQIGHILRFRLAIEGGRVEEVKSMLKSWCEDDNILNYIDLMVLAVEDGNRAMFEILLEEYEIGDTLDTHDWRKFIKRAIRNEDHEMCDLLLNLSLGRWYVRLGLFAEDYCDLVKLARENGSDRRMYKLMLTYCDEFNSHSYVERLSFDDDDLPLNDYRGIPRLLSMAAAEDDAEACKLLMGAVGNSGFDWDNFIDELSEAYANASSSEIRNIIATDKNAAHAFARKCASAFSR
jgi:hypothetical protein